MERYFTRTRVARRFRYHVRSSYNPRGRIHREPCVFCGKRKAEAHHPDYEKAFLVVWACDSCHRKIEHKTLKIGKRHLHDYSSLIVQRPGGTRTGIPQKYMEEAPF